MVQRRIYLVRGSKVMLSTDLAELYRVAPRVLIQAVKRNIHRFPRDFMFQLESAELEILKSQIVISSWGGVRRANPYAFTEQGAAMLSSVLRSRRAVQVNLAIMRAFVRVRQVLGAHRNLARRIEELEKKTALHDAQIVDYQEVFQAVRALLDTPAQAPLPRKSKFGFPNGKTLPAAAQ